MKNEFTKSPSRLFPTGVCELTVRYKRAATKRVKVTAAEEVVEFAREHFYSQEEIESREKFMVMYIDRANQIFAFETHSEGGLSGCMCDPRLVFRSALLCAATNIVLMHNHPSGQNQPSAADLKLTTLMVDAGKFLEITVLDHIIITTTGFYSWASEGLI